MGTKPTKGSNIASRVSDEFRRKAEHVAAAENRKLADWSRLTLERAVAAYEKEHGPIVLP